MCYHYLQYGLQHGLECDSSMAHAHELIMKHESFENFQVHHNITTSNRNIEM